jgi:hypothetical protein
VKSRQSPAAKAHSADQGRKEMIPHVFQISEELSKKHRGTNLDLAAAP